MEELWHFALCASNPNLSSNLATHLPWQGEDDGSPVQGAVPGWCCQNFTALSDDAQQHAGTGPPWEDECCGGTLELDRGGLDEEDQPLVLRDEARGGAKHFHRLSPDPREHFAKCTGKEKPPEHLF